MAWYRDWTEDRKQKCERGVPPSGRPRSGSAVERLQSAYDREASKNSSLSTRIYEVCAERDSLKGQVRDYERVMRAIGPEQNGAEGRGDRLCGRSKGG